MAKISDIAHVIGLRDTADRADVTVPVDQPFVIGQETFYYNPNRNQLLSWILKKARNRPTKVHRFGHAEKAPRPNWVKYIGATETSSQAATGLTFEDGTTRLLQYLRVQVARTGENVYLTAAPSGDNTGAVTRNFGTSGTPYLFYGDQCKILPPLKAEGADMGSGITGGKVWKEFTTSIVEWVIQLTGTKAAERHLDGDPYLNEFADQWEATNDQLQAELIWGAYVNDETGATPLHASQGLLNWITTNVYSLPGFITRMDLWDMFLEWKKWNKEGGALACSDEMRHLVATWAFDKVVYNQDMVKDGINIEQVQSPAGTFDMVEVDVFGQEKNLMGQMIFIPNPGRNQGIDYRPLIGYENRDIRYKPVNRDEKDIKEGMITGETGFEFWGEERFMEASGVEF